MNGVADVFDGDPVAQNNGVGEVRSVARLFGENSDQIKMRPKTIHQVIKIQFHLATKIQTIRFSKV